MNEIRKILETVWDQGEASLHQSRMKKYDIDNALRALSAFPPPAEDARMLVKSLRTIKRWDATSLRCRFTKSNNEAAAAIESFAQSRVEPWREAARNARKALSELAGVRRSVELMHDYPCHSGITTPDKCGRCSRDIAAWDSVDALDALLSDSPAKEAAK